MPKQLAGRCRNGHQTNAVEKVDGEFVCPKCGTSQFQFSLVSVDDSLVADVGALGMAKAWPGECDAV